MLLKLAFTLSPPVQMHAVPKKFENSNRRLFWRVVKERP